jgi:ABC-2 type transport system permease protein
VSTTTAFGAPWAAAITSVRRSLADRGGLVFTIAFHVLVTATLSGVWRAAVGARGGEIAGYSAIAITWYLAATEAVTVSMNSRLIADIGADITSGTVAVELLRPASVLVQRVAIEIGRVLPRVAVCAVSLVVVARVAGGPPPRAATLLLLPISLVLAVSLNVITQHAFASNAFWLRETGATWFLYQKLVFMLGGMLLPLQVLPEWLGRAAWLTPFPAMAYAPGRLAAGHFDWWLLAAQIGWIAVMWCVATWLFARGEARLQVVGG